MPPASATKVAAERRVRSVSLFIDIPFLFHLVEDLIICRDLLYPLRLMDLHYCILFLFCEYLFRGGMQLGTNREHR
jgi:hypothetical protein